MTATNMLVSGVTLNFSGTQFAQQGAIQLCLMCAVSGNALIPVKCDSTGRIGSVF